MYVWVYKYVDVNRYVICCIQTFWYVQHTVYIHTHIYILSKCNIVRTCSEFVKMTSHQDDVPSTRNTWAWPLRFGTTSLPAAAFMVSMRGCASNVPKNPSGLNSWRRGQWVLKQPASSCNPLTTCTVYCMYTIRYRYMHIHIIYKHTYSEGWRLAIPLSVKMKKQFFGLSGSFTCRDGVGTFGASERPPLHARTVGILLLIGLIYKVSMGCISASLCYILFEILSIRLLSKASWYVLKYL